MSAKSKPLQARFSRETRFEVSPIISAPFRGPVEWRLEQLKSTLLRPVLSGMRSPELQSKLCWAANEAASLAWMTPIPLLVFPALFEERVGVAREQWMKQQRIRRLPQPLALAA